MRMRRRSAAHLSHVLLLACTALLVSGFDVEGGGPAAVPRRPGGGPQPPLSSIGTPPASGPGQAVADAAARVSKWYRAYQGFVAAAAKVSHLISFCCGVWLVFATPFAVIGAALTLRGLEVILCAFLGVFGALLLSMELPLKSVERVLQQYFFFAYTRPGRGMLVVHVAALAWACKSIGMLTKTFMAFNALLTFYILNSQDRRFAKVDADAAAALSQAADEMRGSMGEALSFGKMIGAFGGFGGKSRPTASPSAASSSTGPGFGGFDGSPFAAAGNDDSQPSWPTGTGNGGA